MCILTSFGSSLHNTDLIYCNASKSFITLFKIFMVFLHRYFVTTNDEAVILYNCFATINASIPIMLNKC